MSHHDPSRSADLLVRLLGPAGEELTCEECFEQLDRYVELDLSGREADDVVPGMGAHLEGCPACREDHAQSDRTARRGVLADSPVVPRPRRRTVAPGWVAHGVEMSPRPDGRGAVGRAL